MTVLDYCSLVRDAVFGRLEGGDLSAFGDSGLASKAETLALMGEDTEALAIAERLAEKYAADIDRLDQERSS